MGSNIPGIYFYARPLRFTYSFLPLAKKSFSQKKNQIIKTPKIFS